MLFVNLLFLIAVSPAFSLDDHLLLCEAVVTPTESEFVEIVNPTGATLQLDTYYLSDDEDYALLPGALGSGPSPSLSTSDFIVQFPAGASIAPGQVLVVAFDGAGFAAAFGTAPDYEIRGTDPSVPDMIPFGSATSAGLTNSGENVVLFNWDGASDLVSDVDMANIGTPSTSNDIGDKTGISVDGPDADSTASIYATDAFTMPQQAGDPGFGFSTKRIAFEAGNEVLGGNGLTGDDETSEDIVTTWEAPPFTAPNPGVCDLVPTLPVVVINEILQNPSVVSDSAGEWLELFNPTGSPIDINGWTLADDDFDSHVIDNGGPLLIAAGGYLILGNNGDTAINGGVTVDYVYSDVFLGNSVDEVVLFDGEMNEIDRVEYDGGATFPDPNGVSMALIDPSLDNNVGANWCESTATFGAGNRGTPGAANDCVIVAPELVINEILQNPSAVSDGSGEWFEVFNPTGSAIDIDGWTIRDNDFDLHVIANGGPLLVPAGGFLVLGNNTDVGTNGGAPVTYAYSNIFLSNSSDELVLLDALQNEIDRVEWDNGATFPDPNGASMALADPLLDNSDGANWCESSNTFGAGDAGTPGAANDCDSIRVPLVINEIDYDQPGADNAEFVELLNTGDGNLDLDPFSLVLVNGNGGSIYQTVDLPAVVLPAGGYFVVCADATTVANCDLAALNSIQNGSPDAVAVTFGGLIVDTVSYEGDVIAPYTEGSGSGLEDSGATGEDFKGISRFPDGLDTDQNNLDLSALCITPGRPNSSLSANCTAEGPALEIYELQGSGLFSPFVGETVASLDNVVTAVGPDGFFIQTPEIRSDGDINTSDGLFVFTGSAPVVAVGDRVDVAGLMTEFFDYSEISGGPSFTVRSSGNSLPAAVIFDETVPSPDPTVPSCAIEFECYEGMLIEMSGVVTGPNQRFNSDPIAEVFIAAGAERTFREPGIEFPGLVGLPVWDGNPEVFELDPNRLGLPNTIIPAGSTFTATGVIGFEFGDYELWPSVLNVVEATLPRAVRAPSADEFSVGSLNLFRLFDDVNDGGEQVVSSAVYAVRLAKFSLYIREAMLSPDVISVQEVEKVGTLQDLADQIALDDPSVVYTAYLVEGNDVGGIDVGFLVRDTVQVDAVTQLAANEILTFDGSLLHDRPPLLLEGGYFGDGTQPFPLALLAVHNRSLGGIDDATNGPRVRQKRLEQAQSIATIVQDLQSVDPTVRLIVIGDFNAFEFSDGYVDPIGQISGDIDPSINLVSGPDLVDPNLDILTLDVDADERYSFIFRGSSQVLDHALTSSALAPWLRGIEYARGNADAAFDLISDGGTALRSSDHDGLVLYLAKDRDGDQVPDDLDVCLDTEIPEATVPSASLGRNRYALVDGDGTFDTNSPPGGGPGDVFTIEDTAGCSCEQIIAALDLGKGHEKFGCSVGVMRNWVDLVTP